MPSSAYRHVLIFLALGASGCDRNVAPSAPPLNEPSDATPSGKRVVLARFAAPEGEYELSIGRCVDGSCPIKVRWIEGGRPASKYVLPIAAGDQATRTELVDVSWGADEGLQAFITGEESAYVGTAARLFSLGANSTALLVTQRHGFDHLKRSHRLLLHQGSELAVVWQFDEAAGATYSATEVVRTASGSADEVALLRGRFSAEPESVDQLVVERLAWNGSAKTLELRKPESSTATALLVGDFPSVAAARAARTARLDCFRTLWVLGSDSVPGLVPQHAALGLVFAQPEAADRHLKQLAGCAASLAMRVVPVPERPSSN